MPHSGVEGVRYLLISLAGEDKIQFQKAMDLLAQDLGGYVKIEAGFLHVEVQPKILIPWPDWDLGGQVEVPQRGFRTYFPVHIPGTDKIGLYIPAECEFGRIDDLGIRTNTT
jgi:hypothetical protein